MKVNITICSSNTIYNLIKQKIHSTLDKYTNSGVYNLYALHASFSMLDKLVKVLNNDAVNI